MRQMGEKNLIGGYLESRSAARHALRATSKVPESVMNACFEFEDLWQARLDLNQRPLVGSWHGELKIEVEPSPL
jgi:hypothetical protein